MARIKIELADGSVGDIEAALRSAGFGVAEAEETARRLLNTTQSTFHTDRFRRLGIDTVKLVAGLRAAGLRVQYTGVEPPVSPSPASSPRAPSPETEP